MDRFIIQKRANQGTYTARRPCIQLLFTWVRDFAEGYDLIEQNSKGPHVRFDGKGAVVNGLRSGPLYGELGTCGKDLNIDSFRSSWC